MNPNQPIRDARTLGVPKMLILGLQHMFAMFGATILVPILVRQYGLPLSIQTTLFFAGIGTLFFHVCSKFQVPAFLGSSFAFLGGFATMANLDSGMYAAMDPQDKLSYACGGIVVAGLLYLILALVIKLAGVKKVMRFLPPVVTGPIIVCIGLTLAPSAVSNASTCWPLALIALATMMEHIGDMSAISATTERNFLQDPGLHRTLVGDGLATSLSAMFGGPANTTYGENTGVLVLSNVHDPRVIRIAACFAVILGFIPKMAEVIGSMPSAIVGGVSFILYGMISAIGVRNIVENQVDFTKSRNLIIAAVILVCGLGFSSGLTFHVAGTSITLTGLAIAALAGIILNAILPGNDYEFGANPEGDQNRGIHA